MAFNDLYRKQVELLVRTIPLAERDAALIDIDLALKRIADRIRIAEKNVRVNDELRNAIIVYMISHDHSPHSLLNPVLRNITQDFEQNFMGMTREHISLDVLLSARDRLIANVTSNMPEKHKALLVALNYFAFVGTHKRTKNLLLDFFQLWFLFVYGVNTPLLRT
jgi:hypothetical protein